MTPPFCVERASPQRAKTKCAAAGIWWHSIPADARAGDPRKLVAE
jgi:hypothetical protein